jgi:hypothetical protein
VREEGYVHDEVVQHLRELQREVTRLRARVRLLWSAMLLAVIGFVPIALVRAATNGAQHQPSGEVVRARLFVVTDEKGQERAEFGFGASPMGEGGKGEVAPHLTLLAKDNGGSAELSAHRGGAALFLGGGELYSLSLLAHANASEARFLGGGGSTVLKHDESSNELGLVTQGGPAMLLSNTREGSGLVLKDGSDKDRVAIVGVGASSLVLLNDAEGGLRAMLGIQAAKGKPVPSKLLLLNSKGSVTFEAPQE